MVNPLGTEDIKLHLQEADDLKKEWFAYVFESIRKLYDKIESNSLQLLREKEELLRLLIDYKDDVSKTIQDSNLKNREDLEKLKTTLERTIETITKQLTGLELGHSRFRNDVDNDFSKLKLEFKNLIDIAFKEHIAAGQQKETDIDTALKTLGDSSLVMSTKLGIYIVIISFIVTTLITAAAGSLLVLFKDALKAFFMGA